MGSKLLRYRIAQPWLWTYRAAGIFPTKSYGFRILLFHDIPEKDMVHFEALVAYVAKAHGILTPKQASSRLTGVDVSRETTKSKRLPCVFSFDDGFVSNYTVAKQILAQHGIAGLFFVAPGLIDLPWADQRASITEKIFRGRIRQADLPINLRCMTWGELSELKELGHEIGCHGMTHSRLTDLDEAARHHEIVASGDLLDARLGQKTAWYAFAFGDKGSIDKAALRIIAQRYQYCRCGLRGANDIKTSVFALRADSIPQNAPSAYHKLLIEGALDFRYRKSSRQLSYWANEIQKPLRPKN